MSIRHKRGDTFRPVVRLRYNDEPVPADWTVRCQMRDRQKNLIKDFAPIEVVDAGEGLYALNATKEETKLWQPGEYESDVEFTSPGGFRISGPTFSISIERDITRTEGGA